MKRMLNVLGLVALFALCSVGGQVSIETAKAAFWQWSKSSSSNGNSDPTISWIEGMPPSVVNDSGRALMARLAEQFADTSGALATAGGPTAYTVTTSQGFPNPPNDGMVLGVTFNVDSSGGPTLSADGGPAYAIDSSPGVPTTVSAGIPFTLIFRSAGGGAWIVRGGSGGGGAPLGSVIAYTGTTEPSTSLKFANGQCLSTTTYATYWGLVGSPAPSYCAAGQFPIIDLRGRFVAGLDNLGGAAAAGRLTSAGTGCGTAFTSVGVICGNGTQSHTLSVPELAQHHHSAGISDPGHGHTVNQSFAWLSSACSHCGIGGGGDFGGPGTTSISINNNTTGIHVNGGGLGNDVTYDAGSNQPFPLVPPVIGVNYLVRVQ
jgi:hypothetical protein